MHPWLARLYLSFILTGGPQVVAASFLFPVPISYGQPDPQACPPLSPSITQHLLSHCVLQSQSRFFLILKPPSSLLLVFALAFALGLPIGENAKAGCAHSSSLDSGPTSLRVFPNHLIQSRPPAATLLVTVIQSQYPNLFSSRPYSLSWILFIPLLISHMPSPCECHNRDITRLYPQ